jgi:hypothetical protein
MEPLCPNIQEVQEVVALGCWAVHSSFEWHSIVFQRGVRDEEYREEQVAVVGFGWNVSFHEKFHVSVSMLGADHDDTEYVVVLRLFQGHSGESRVAHEPAVAGACGSMSG